MHALFHKTDESNFSYDSAIFSMNFSNPIVNQSLASGISKANRGKAYIKVLS
jgi:hypothetical protein